jgi:hypothetical protein
VQVSTVKEFVSAHCEFAVQAMEQAEWEQDEEQVPGRRQVSTVKEFVSAHWALVEQATVQAV